MYIKFLTGSILLFLWTVTNTYSQSINILFQTNYGNFKVMLYDFTPHHRDMFVAAIKKGDYKDALFNRIIKDFVVQGGEHDEDIAAQETKQGYLFPRLNPEFDNRAYHKIGALGAGRDDNTNKASFLNQIYFVVGKPYSPAEFDSIALKYNKQFTPETRTYYLRNGGQPRLDGDYTVFGEVIEGLDVLIKISNLTVDKKHYPIKKLHFTVRLLTG